jgi:hypothetical protein
MSQQTVNAAQDQWQKGQVATSHYVRDKTYKSADVDDIDFGELVVYGPDPETEVRQPDEIVAAQTGKAYAIVSGVCTITAAAHGLEVGQKVTISADSYTPGAGAVLDGIYVVTGTPTTGTFTIATAEADRTSETLTYTVVTFVLKDIAGIVVKPVTGGRAKRFSDGYLKYSLGDVMTILKEGDVAVELGATVSAQDDAFYVNSPGGASAQYTWRNDVDTDKAVQVPGRFLQAGVSGDIVMMRFNLDAVLGT